MPDIHQLPHWPNLTWNNDVLISLLSAIRYEQGLLLGHMARLGFDVKSQSHLEVLLGEVIHSSAIENEILNPEEVRSSLARKLGLEQGGLSPVSRLVEGMVDMLLDATEQCTLPLTKKRLWAWQGALFPTGRSGLHTIAVGRWRTPESDPMQVVSGPIGRTRVHFEAPAAERLEEEMARFLVWFNKSENIDPIIKAGVAHFWFVTLHPFEDGNGRIARAIADMCLARSDGLKQRFYSMSAQIESMRKSYYDTLEQCQKGPLDITRWLHWFLTCLRSAIKQAEVTLEKIGYKAWLWERLSQHTVNERQRKVVNRLLEDFKGKLTTSKYAKIAKCSQDTALRDIHLLMDYGCLQKGEGEGRSTHYVLIKKEACISAGEES